MLHHCRALALVTLILVFPACTDDRAGTAIAAASSTVTSKAQAEALHSSLRQYLDRMRTLVSNTAIRIQAKRPDNKVRRVCLLWQIQTNEVCLDIVNRGNTMVALVQTWYWTVAMERFISVGEGQDLFGEHQEMARATAMNLRQECETFAARFLDPKPYEALKADIDSTAGKGELFTSTSQQRNDTLDRILSATRIESLFNIVLSPFDAMSGVGKTGDSLEEMTRVANRAVLLAERYPQLIGLNLQMAAIEMQEQEAPAKAFEDFHSMARTGEQLSETLRAMPEKLRQETQALLAQSGPAQADARATLDKVHEAGLALEKAASAIDQGLKSLDTFVAHAAALGHDAQAGAQSTDKPSPPFDIKDYATTAAAVESLAKELRATIADLERGLGDAGVNGRLTALIDGRLATARTESERLLEHARNDAGMLLAQTRTQVDQLLIQARSDADALVDHTAKRIAQLLALAAALIVTVVLLLRFAQRAKT